MIRVQQKNYGLKKLFIPRIQREKKHSKQRGALKGGAPRVTFLHKRLLFSLISEGMPDYCSACATI